jgi:hypothetical protein
VIKKLKGSKKQYRLRTGNYRVLFELEGNPLRYMMSVTARYLQMSTTTAKRPLATRAINEQIRRAKSVLLELRETLEDLEDRRTIDKAKRRNGKKACAAWPEVARELGITAPTKKH